MRKIVLIVTAALVVATLPAARAASGLPVVDLSLSPATKDQVKAYARSPKVQRLIQELGRMQQRQAL
jgi:hypothetical protein